MKQRTTKDKDLYCLLLNLKFCLVSSTTQSLKCLDITLYMLLLNSLMYGNVKPLNIPLQNLYSTWGQCEFGYSYLKTVRQGWNGVNITVAALPVLAAKMCMLTKP